MSISIADKLTQSKTFTDSVAKLYGNGADVREAASKYASIAEIHIRFMLPTNCSTFFLLPIPLLSPINLTEIFNKI